MRIVFLGSYSENKKILLLSMAKVLSLEHSVKIFSTHRYDYDEGYSDVYDFCGTEIHHFDTENRLKQVMESNPCDYALIDTHLALNAGHDIKLASLLKAERSSFEETVEQTRALLEQYPYTDIHLIYYDVPEYSRVNGKFLETLYCRRINDSVNLTKNYTIYFEEENAAAFLESLYEERLTLKRFTPVWKMQLLNILSDLTGIELKQLKEYLKKSERMK